ncbi:MAG: gamma-glutamylcyclotransferase family protein [Halocynthiibacter sp.]
MGPHFFGYGSLVNSATHSYHNPRPAYLRGWRRTWRHTHHRKVSFLTAVPCPQSEIWGVVAEVPNKDWAALDAREYAYDRHNITDHIFNTDARPTDTAIYAIETGGHHAPTDAHPILLSYIDVVLRGYFDLFGDDGIAHFIATTDGWDAPILNDRARPLYPRAQALTKSETAQTDHALMTLSVEVEKLQKADLAFEI